jgi:CHAD domain-containing protein
MTPSTDMAATHPHSASLGLLVQAYVGEQCRVILTSRAAIAARDEDAVHPVRVAIRRLRATLRTFGAVYRKDARSDFAHELRWAGNILGEVRDLQVLAERFAAEDRTAAPAMYRAIAEEIDRDRAGAWDRVAEGLGSARGASLFETIAHWREAPPFAPRSDRPVENARKRVETADAEVTKRLARVSDAATSDAGELLHDVRKAAKRHRYAVELAQPVLGEKAARTIERRQALQDALGAHQDAVVALAYLEQIRLDAQSGAAPGDLGELIARTRARAEDVDGVLRETERLLD